MKHSIIISTNSLLYKLIFFLSVIISFLILYNQNPSDNLLENIIKEAFLPKEQENKIVFFDASSEVRNITNSNATKKIPVTVLKSNEKKKEPVLQKKELHQDNDVDFSKDNSQKSITDNGITISNSAKKSINITNLLNSPLLYNDKGGYKVLIIHTHTTECYLPDDRSEDQSKNIVRVGEEFAKVLNENNIKTLHIKKVHDSPYSKSYINELATIKETLQQYPTIEVVIDVHRDALYGTDNQKLKPVTIIDNERAAQVMLVCGTDAMGLPHNTWQNCLSFATKIQQKMISNYPNLARPIDLREERFNTNMTNNSIIFEIGANGNTLEEAVLGGHYAAQCIADVLKNK